MIQFNKNNNYPTFTFSVSGDKKEYIETIKSLLTLLSAADSNLHSAADRLRICNLIKGMLISEEQIENTEKQKESSCLIEKQMNRKRYFKDSY
ncbi:MAG: hypothetical protein GX963_03025 [Bacteroidales bacterium]|nr:hypothetical protein [Bacteroidales bacterium]